jgi:cytochrome c peroxidase
MVKVSTMAGNRLVLSGTNGVPGWTYYVLTSSNLAQPLNQWAITATNTFDTSGDFNFTNLMAGGLTQQFYRLSLDMAASALPYTIGLFKTPTVRDLSSSEPYFHTGRMNTIEDAVNFYANFSPKARAGQVRNADPQLSSILLDTNEVTPLAAFLRSLNEDYTDVPCPCQ